MSIQYITKKDFFVSYSPTRSAKDSGSPESQIALFTHRIAHLTQHLSTHKKDKDALQRGLKKMVGKRKRLLRYLENESIERYRSICKTLSF